MPSVGLRPKPRSRDWIQRQDLPTGFHFEAVGVSAVDGDVAFYPPANAAHVSFSAAPGAGQTGAPVAAPVRWLATLCGRNGHAELQVLKLDIEGFE